MGTWPTLEDNPQAEIGPNIPFDLVMQPGKTKSWHSLVMRTGRDFVLSTMAKVVRLIVTLMVSRSDMMSMIVRPSDGAATITEELMKWRRKQYKAWRGLLFVYNVKCITEGFWWKIKLTWGTTKKNFQKTLEFLNFSVDFFWEKRYYTNNLLLCNWFCAAVMFD